MANREWAGSVLLEGGGRRERVGRVGCLISCMRRAMWSKGWRAVLCCSLCCLHCLQCLSCFKNVALDRVESHGIPHFDKPCALFSSSFPSIKLERTRDVSASTACVSGNAIGGPPPKKQLRVWCLRLGKARQVQSHCVRYFYLSRGGRECVANYMEYTGVGTSTSFRVQKHCRPPTNHRPRQRILVGVPGLFRACQFFRDVDVARGYPPLNHIQPDDSTTSAHFLKK